ncbi:MAG TPA: serine hydrolase [Thermoanaerobaculia bacterium]|jgi:CubicO group peptidase (beta-lactamase class C family)
MRRSLLLLLLFSLSAQAVPRKTDALIRRLMHDGEVPGLSIVAVHRGRIAWQQAYGVANAKTGAPLTTDAIFESASLTKPIFAYAVLQLAARGVLSLDVPLHDYLPEPVTDERMKRITARMVLSHTTGLQNEVMPGQTLAVHFEPGARFSYSGAGYLWLQRVVEHRTGKALTPLMQELVFEPFGMRDSSYVWLPSYETRKVYGHNPAGTVAERRKPTTATVATLHTTPRDYARFVIAMMQRGANMRIAQVAVDESCFTCLDKTSVTPSPSLSWGLGWALERTARGTAFWHWGENNAEIQNFAMAYPDGDAVIVFTNSGNGFSIMPEVVESVLGGPHPAFAFMHYEHYDSPSKQLLRAALARGAGAALQSELVNKLTESQLNNIGYGLLQRGRIADAVLVFERNVQRFPSSANVHDSMGEAYAAAGAREQAIASYARSLELDPKNSNAAVWLEKLKASR